MAVPGLWKDLQEKIHHEGSRAEPAHVRLWPFLSTLFKNVQDQKQLAKPYVHIS